MPTTAKTRIFLTGVTGYIGGAVLSRLLKHPQASTFDITVLLRNADKARILQDQFGVTAVVGTHEEYDKIKALAEQADVIFELAESDNVPFIQAIIDGLKLRHSKTGDVPIFIHTSGTGTLVDDARGAYATETIYSDLDVEQIKSIPDSAFHRDVDLPVTRADFAGYAKSYIVLPSTIYGVAKNPLVDAGVSNAHSMQIPDLIKAAIRRKRAGMIGKGKNVWPHVHIEDVGDFYIGLFDSIRNKPNETGHGWEGFYFLENGEYNFYKVTRAIGEVLVELGVTEEAEPTSFTVEELPKYFKSERFGNYMGTNSRCRADRARAIGWAPKYTTEHVFKSIRPEVEYWLAKLQA